MQVTLSTGEEVSQLTCSLKWLLIGASMMMVMVVVQYLCLSLLDLCNPFRVLRLNCVYWAK